MNDIKYNPREIEPKWGEVWEKEKLYQADDFSEKKKYYILIEFPYPSGAGLHVGHARSWTAMDAFSRKKRMEGYNVMYPIGWDAFGLPAENYAIKMGVNPSRIVPENITNFKRQIKSLGVSFDYSREINTTDPKYYKWTQWIFLQFYKHDMAYQAEVPVNWCPTCKTTLADEEVLTGGIHERCGNATERRMQKQWLLRITKYADRLIEDLEKVDYSSKISTQQVNWIGRSEGAIIEFSIFNSQFSNKERKLEVFTTRPDTLYGATFLVLSPEYAQKLMDFVPKDKKETVSKYIATSLKKSELERQAEEKAKTGVDTGVKAINPVSGEEIPVFVADYVLAGYGTGAIMGVPAHDTRDFEFAKKYNLLIRRVIAKKDVPIRSYLMGASDITDQDLAGLKIRIVKKTKEGDRKIEIPKESIRQYEKLIEEKMSPEYWNEYVGDEIVFVFKNKQGDIYRLVLNWENEERIGRMAAEWNNETYKEGIIWKMFYENDWYRSLIVHDEVGIIVNSGDWNGLQVSEDLNKIISDIQSKGLGKKEVQYHLRDWVFSRQHYWGEPIPIVFCENCAKNKKRGHPEFISGSNGIPKQVRNDSEYRDYAIVPVPEKDLPVELPYLEKYEPTGTGESPLASVTDWVNAKCPVCKGKARRETDTMPNWAGSNWYYLAYLFANKLENQKSSVRQAQDKGQNLEEEKNIFTENKDLINYWMPVDIYQGGFEHTTLHLLYSRFVYKFLYDIGAVPTDEPYAKRRSHGIVLGPDGRKMSKSFGNVINPDDIVRAFGADTLRIYEMFMGPFDQTIAWSEESVEGCFRFLKRVWQLAQTKVLTDGKTSNNLQSYLHKTIKKVGEDIDALKFNTAVAMMMEFINVWQADEKGLDKDDLKNFLLVLAPFAPFMTEEIYQHLRAGISNLQFPISNENPKSKIQNPKFESIHLQTWPEYDPKYLEEDEVVIVVQVNGKRRGEIKYQISKIKDQKDIEEKAKDAAKKHLEGKIIRKVVYVPGKIVNFVV